MSPLPYDADYGRIEYEYRPASRASHEKAREREEYHAEGRWTGPDSRHRDRRYDADDPRPEERRFTPLRRWPVEGGVDYSGRGPRGYRRSDEWIREDLIETLARDPWIDATYLNVQVNGGEVTLEGQVDDRRQRRLAEEVAWSIYGVDNVTNRIKVQREPRGAGRDEGGWLW